MRLFRNLLFWLLLALGGALAAQMLLQDPGEVLVRFRGFDYRTSVAWAVFGVIGTIAALWLLWTLLTLPFRALRGRRGRQSHGRLAQGLSALRQGHWSRAESLLVEAAEDNEDAAIARVYAAKAAQARGDADAARRHLQTLGSGHAGTRAIAIAEGALADDRPTDALVALDAPDAQPLPPRGLALRARAYAVSGVPSQAYGLLGAMRQQQSVPAAQLDDLQLQWAEAMLREADANALAEHWESLPKPVRAERRVVTAYAQRAAALHWDEAAARSLEQALATRWDETLATLYLGLPIGQVDSRRAQAERWLQAQPGSPSLLLGLARFARERGDTPQARDYLQRAIAQGAGSEAWEELGHVHALADDDRQARAAYANALRAARGEPLQVAPAQSAAMPDGDRQPTPPVA
ncbi:MAG TPA: heme biosynthesis HemY N-terminal domain-containing protein [Xanthomonadaceae bacterium]|nr:heme biosynthesis HemY N-terminal domain-containing protein [Xanthomonadaceae bacterium]